MACGCFFRSLLENLQNLQNLAVQNLALQNISKHIVQNLALHNISKRLVQNLGKDWGILQNLTEYHGIL